MSCYHPLKGFVLGVNANGKRDMKITSYDVDHLEIYRGKTYQIVSKSIQAPHVRNMKLIDDYVTIPCGQCIGCRIDYSRQWANRMMLELPYHATSCFITLTYNDEHVPLSTYVDYNGEEQLSLTLHKRHFQLFMKRLRKSYPDVTIRFYACGEYGDTTHRPHYHAILYGVDFSEDRALLGFSRDGYPQFVSANLEKLWPFGYSMICDVSWQTCAYVARYVTKKHKGKTKDFYEYFNIEPEFSLMSRRPGIGRKYYDDNRDKIYERQEIFISTPKGGLKVKPPRYYDSLYDIDCHDEMERIKKARQEMSDNISYAKLKRTDNGLLEMLYSEEQSFENKVKALRRDSI